MNAVELTGSTANSTGPPPNPMLNFWPTTFLRQIAVMCRLSSGLQLFYADMTSVPVSAAFTTLVLVITFFKPLHTIMLFAKTVLRFAASWVMVKLWLYNLWLWCWRNSQIADPSLADLNRNTTSSYGKKRATMQEKVRRRRYMRKLERDCPDLV
jgi:hypothetical protein